MLAASNRRPECLGYALDSVKNDDIFMISAIARPFEEPRNAPSIGEKRPSTEKALLVTEGFYCINANDIYIYMF